MDKNWPLIVTLLWLAFGVTLFAFVWNTTLFFKHKKEPLPTSREVNYKKKKDSTI